jgi:hypothetical protein
MSTSSRREPTALKSSPFVDHHNCCDEASQGRTSVSSDVEIDEPPAVAG